MIAEKSELLKSTNISPMSFGGISNEDSLELARLKASQPVVNLDQFYPEITSRLFDSDDKPLILADYSGDLEMQHSEDGNFDGESSFRLNETEIVESVSISSVKKEPSNEEKSNNLTLVTKSWTGGKIPNISFSMNEILDIQTSNHYAAGMVALKSGEYVKSISHFSRCIHLKPKEASFYVNRAEVFVQLVDFQSAIVNYKRACFLDTTNSDYLERLAFLYIFHSQILCDQGLHMHALESIGRAIEIIPNNPAYEIRAIVCLAALGRNHECLALINKQIDENDCNGDFFVLRAKLQTHFRSFSLSYYDLIAALNSDPMHVEAKLMLGRMTEIADDFKNAAVELALHNRLSEAINKISMAIDLNPKVGEYHIKRGAFYRRLKNFPAAVDDLILAMDKVDHNEQHDTYRNAERQLVLTFNDFAVECFENRCFPESIKLLTKAIQTDRSEPLFYVNRGDCFFKTCQWQFALADYNQAKTMVCDGLRSKILSRIALVHFSIGYEKFRDDNAGDYRQSEQAFTEAIKNNPLSFVFWNSRAKCRYVLENYSGSRRDLITGLLLTPELDRSVESIFNRLFQNSTVSQVIESKLGEQVRVDFNRLLKERNETIDPVPVTKLDSKVVSMVQNFDKIQSCVQEDKFYTDCVQNYNQVNKKLKQCSTNNKFIKNSKLNISALPDLNISNDGLNSDIVGIVGTRDGQKFIMDSEGVLIKPAKEKGWRKFKSGIELK